MRLLLDTHALLWWLTNDTRMGASARALIADRDNDVLVSVVSLWEIILKSRIGKLQADIGEIEQTIARDGMIRLAISQSHLAALSAMPAFHRDPFDHLLLAQSIVENATFLSDDRHAPLYPVRLMTCGQAPS